MLDLVQVGSLPLEIPDHDTHDHRNHGQETHDHGNHDLDREVRSQVNQDHGNQEREIHIPVHETHKTHKTHGLIHNQDTSHENTRLSYREGTTAIPVRGALLYHRRNLNPA